MPVILPLVTIMWRDSSPIFMPLGARCSCAIRSKRGSVVSNSVRSRLRISDSIRLQQVSMRSHRRSA